MTIYLSLLSLSDRRPLSLYCVAAISQMIMKVSPNIKPMLTNVNYNREQWKKMGMELSG